MTASTDPATTAIERALAGDESAFRWIVETHSSDMRQVAFVVCGDLVLYPGSGATTLVPGICGAGETATLMWPRSSDDRLLVGVNGANGRFRLYHVNADGKSDPQPLLLPDTVGPGNEKVFWND